MAMYRTKPVEAQALDFDRPELIAEVAAWCGGKAFGRKLMIDKDGRGDLAYQGWYVVKTADGGFLPCEPGLFTALFEPDSGERKPRRQTAASNG